MEDHSILNDATFWFAVSFVIFLLLVWQMGRKAIGSALDGYAAKVKSDLEQAASLHAEAVKFLEDTKTKHAGAVKEAENIVSHAREQAKNISEQAGKDLDSSLKRREAQALDRIKMLEEQALSELRAETAKLAINAAEILLRDKVDASFDEKLIETQTAQMAAGLKKVA